MCPDDELSRAAAPDLLVGGHLIRGGAEYVTGRPLKGARDDRLQVFCQGSMCLRVIALDGQLWVVTSPPKGSEPVLPDPSRGAFGGGLLLNFAESVPVVCVCGATHVLDAAHLAELADRLGGARDRKLRRVNVDNVRSA